MIVKLLTEHHLESLSLKGCCRGSSESTHVKMPHCWKSRALAQIRKDTKNYIAFLTYTVRHTGSYNKQITNQQQKSVSKNKQQYIGQTMRSYSICIKSLFTCAFAAIQCLNPTFHWAAILL